jgi:5,10-methylenetetrahydrofolate reductase
VYIARVKVPQRASLTGAPQVIERLAWAEGLENTFKGAHRSYPGSFHWHFRKAGSTGTLDVTCWPRGRAIWIAVHSNREGTWTRGEALRLRKLIQNGLGEASRPSQPKKAPSIGHWASDRLTFLKVVEVLPPPRGQSRIEGARTLAQLAEEVRKIRTVTDVLLVADLKGRAPERVDPVSAATYLKKNAEVDAAPVIVIRGLSRSEFRSAVLTSLRAGLNWAMIAWGDDLPEGQGSSNLRGYPDLASAIREAASIRASVRSKVRFFAPVNVQGLRHASGVAMAKQRLKAGADLLLSQPPTTDSQSVFDDHLSLITDSMIRGRVLLNVFHFRSYRDAGRYEALFGWELPSGLQATARKGQRALIEAEKGVVRRARKEGLAGVYVSTRGIPQVAGTLLG